VTRAAAPRLALGAGLAAGLAIGLAACGGGQVRSGGVDRDDAIVQVKSNVRDAQVFVDGRFIAPLHAVGGGIAVEPGFHRFELRHDDYFSSYLELDLSRAERKRVEMEMAPVLP
jgi:hypothetical protein